MLSFGGINRLAQAFKYSVINIGRPLRGSLKGYWKLRVGNYRIVFKLAESKILVLAIMDRKTVYQQSERRVDK